MRQKILIRLILLLAFSGVGALLGLVAPYAMLFSDSARSRNRAMDRVSEENSHAAAQRMVIGAAFTGGIALYGMISGSLKRRRRQ